MEEAETVTKFVGQRLEKAGPLQIHISLSQSKLVIFRSKLNLEGFLGDGLTKQRHASFNR